MFKYIDYERRFYIDSPNENRNKSLNISILLNKDDICFIKIFYYICMYIHIWKSVHRLYLEYIEIIIRKNSFKPKKLYKSPGHKRLRFLFSLVAISWIAIYLVIDDLYK